MIDAIDNFALLIVYWHFSIVARYHTTSGGSRPTPLSHIRSILCYRKRLSNFLFAIRGQHVFCSSISGLRIVDNSLWSCRRWQSRWNLIALVRKWFERAGIRATQTRNIARHLGKEAQRQTRTRRWTRPFTEISQMGCSSNSSSNNSNRHRLPLIVISNRWTYLWVRVFPRPRECHPITSVQNTMSSNRPVLDIAQWTAHREAMRRPPIRKLAAESELGWSSYRTNLGDTLLSAKGKLESWKRLDLQLFKIFTLLPRCYLAVSFSFEMSMFCYLNYQIFSLPTTAIPWCFSMRPNHTCVQFESVHFVLALILLCSRFRSFVDLPLITNNVWISSRFRKWYSLLSRIDIYEHLSKPPC